MGRFILIASLFLLLVPITARALSISPSVFEIKGNRGEVMEEKLTIINPSGSDQTYYLGVMAFVPSKTGDSPIFLEKQDTQDGLAQWIQLPFSDVRVPARAKVDVPFKIAIPWDVVSRGYYAAVTVSQAPADLVAGNGAIVEAKVAALILMTVEGETIEQLALINLSADTDDRFRSSFPNTFRFAVQNQGNVHVLPVGAIVLKDFFGREIASYDANPNAARVLPASTREYVTKTDAQEGWWNTFNQQMRLFAIGPINTELFLTYGSDQKLSESLPVFWYVPWQLLVSAAVVLFILIGCIRLLSKRK